MYIENIGKANNYVAVFTYQQVHLTSLSEILPTTSVMSLSQNPRHWNLSFITFLHDWRCFSIRLMEFRLKSLCQPDNCSFRFNFNFFLTKFMTTSHLNGFFKLLLGKSIIFAAKTFGILTSAR